MSQQDVTYKALDFDGTERRANYRTVAYRIDILHVLDKKDAAAIIFQIIYRWLTEYKRDEALKEIEKRNKQGLPPCTQEEIENMLWVRMSYNDFVRESGGAVAYNTVIRMLDYLLDTKKVLERRPSTEPQHADFEYRINKEEVSKLLKELPSAPAFTAKWSKKKKDSTHLGTPVEDALYDSDSTQMGADSTHLGRVSTQMGTALYPNGYPTHTTHIPPHTTHMEENAHVSDDNAPTPSLSSNSPLSLQETSIEESTPAPSDEQSSKQESSSSDSQSKDVPPAQETGNASSGKGNKGSKPGTTTAKKPTPGAEEKALRRQVQQWIDEKRGYKLYGSATEKQIFAEQNAVSMFALKLLNEQQGNHEEGCTWDELDHLWKETRKDTYWGKPENIGRIGGYALQQQFTTIILGKYRKTKLKQMRNQNAAQGATQTGTNMSSAVQEHRQMSELERRNAELRAKYGRKQIS